jgi:hypothetical protein
MRVWLVAASIASVLLIGAMAHGKKQYKDWTPAPPQNCVGEYLFFPDVGDAVDRPMWQITVRMDGDKLSVVLEATLGAKKTRATLTSPSLAGARLRGRFVGPLPAGVLPEVDGRFVDAYPPANAKGPVERGLLVGDRFFVRSDSEP